jgi:hypothetical protein
MDVNYKKTRLFRDTISSYCKLGNPRRAHASINSKYCCLQNSTLCNSPISSTKNSFSTSHHKINIKKLERKKTLLHICYEDPLNYQRQRQRQTDQQSSTLEFARDEEHTLCLRLIWLRPVLSPIGIHNSLIIPTLPTSLELLTTTHHLLCLLCVCVGSLGFVSCLLRVHNSGLRSLRICELGVACAQFWFALLRVLCV